MSAPSETRRTTWPEKRVPLAPAVPLAVRAGAFLPFFLFGVAFGVFAVTLVPGVLSGDAGEFAYHPLVLGIPHPTGYPFYLLAGRLWIYLVPVGEPAWRMNLFSAFWGALAVAWLAGFLRRAFSSTLVAVLGAVALLVTPDFWRYSTATAVYSLHAFLVILTLDRLYAWWQRFQRKAPTEGVARAVFLAVGLGLTNHLTFGLFLVGLAPLVFLLVRAEFRQKPGWRAGLSHLVRLVWPAPLSLLLYLYLPLRARALIGHDSWTVSLISPEVARGLVSPFYRPGLRGFISYVLGRSLLTDLNTGWTALPSLWWEMVWRPLLPGWLLLIVLGAVLLWRWQRWAVLSLGLVYFLSGSLALKYWQDFARNQEVAHVEGHLMTVHVIHALLLGIGLMALRKWSARGRWLTGSLALLLFLPQAAALARHPPTSDREESRAIQAYWNEALAHPLPDGAALMGHWGDLTPFWYQQHALGRRPDLVGLFPPSAEMAAAWLQTGRALYLAGPVLDWGDDLATQFRLVPDGIFVRVELPTGIQPVPPQARAYFGPALRLVEVQSPPVWHEGETVAIAIRWWAEAPVPRDLLLVLRLRDESGNPVVEWHRRFASLWDPRARLPAGQEVISRPFLEVPWGMPDGLYRLEVEVFDPATGQTWGGTGEDGSPFTLPVTLKRAQRPPAIAQVEKGKVLKWRGVHLAIADPPAGTFYPGQEVPLIATWIQILEEGKRQYIVQFRLEPQTKGQSVQVWEVPLTLNSRWPEPVADMRRQVLRLRLAAGVPAGTYRLVVTLRDSDGNVQPSWGSLWRRSATVPLTEIEVAKRERHYTVPATAHPVGARFGGRIELVGYERRAPDQMVLYWRAQQEIPLALTVFVHLLDTEGNLMGQADHVPQGGRAPTTGWLPGEVVADAFSLPLEPQPGWRLRVGLYDPVSGSRLPLDGGGDAVEIVWEANGATP